MMWGCPIHFNTTYQWAQGKHTPPYISSTPSIMHFSVKKGDEIILSSDGLRSCLQSRGVPPENVGNMIVSLAGMDLLDVETLLSYENTLGHSFIPSGDIANVADRVIRNVLFGLDDHRMAEEIMATVNRFGDRSMDDMSVVVVNIM
jgi:pyruvate dehydrogenase phosphatase